MGMDVKLSFFQHDRVLREPLLLSAAALREVLLIASGFDEARVKLVCRTVKEKGYCRLRLDEGAPVYHIERLSKGREH